jgi:hypothetical protein
MATTIANPINPEDVHDQMRKLHAFFESEQAKLAGKVAEAEQAEAERVAAEAEATRVVRHAEADEIARALIAASLEVDRHLEAAAKALQARRDYARQIKRIAPDKAREFGNVFDQLVAPTSAVTAAGLAPFVRMAVRGSISLHEHDERYLQTFNLTAAKARKSP